MDNWGEYSDEVGLEPMITDPYIVYWDCGGEYVEIWEGVIVYLVIIHTPRYAHLSWTTFSTVWKASTAKSFGSWGSWSPIVFLASNVASLFIIQIS